MASPLKLIWAGALLAAVWTTYVVRTAPTVVQEAVAEKAGKAVDVDETIVDTLTEDGKIDEEPLLAKDEHGEALKGDEEEKEEVVEDAMDEVLNGGKETVIQDLKDDIIDEDDAMEIDDGSMETDDVITGSSSDYQWEHWQPSSEYDLDTLYFQNLPDEPSEWSSNFDLYDEKYLPYYSSGYLDENGADVNPDDNIIFDVPLELFKDIPVEELNNNVDQTVDEFLCMLGLCNDVRVYPDDKEWEEPNEIQFTEEGMIGNGDEVEEKSEERDIYAVDAKPKEQGKEATNISTKAETVDRKLAPVGSRHHRGKRDLSWDELERDNELLSKINSLKVDEAEGKTAEDDTSLTAADRFEDLLEYFKDEAAEYEKAAGGEEIYLGVSEPVLNQIVREATGGEFQDVVEDEEALEEAEDQANLEDGIEEVGEFIEDADEGDGWGAYLVPGSPYVKDALKYDGYKRDDEEAALKVYIESLQNLEGYRKRADLGDDGSRSAADFLRQLVPRSPPNAIRYPKTGLEPFSREKYFPLFSGPDGMADVEDDEEDLVAIDQEGLLEKYNQLMELLNTELEASALVSTIQDMAAELGRDRQLLDELAEEEAEAELQLALNDNNEEILELVGITDSHPMKRAPRVIDYPDFNEYPPEFYRSVPAFEGNDLSEEELLELYTEYLNEAAKEAKWGEYINQPRERREGEDSLPGPYGAYYVQGRMMGNLMKPKRDWEDTRDDLAAEEAQEAEVDQPYVLLDPSDLGYVEWPGDFEIFYDTRDGTYVLYPYPDPQDASDLSDEALLDALGLSDRNFVVDGDGDEEGEEWGDFKGDGVLQNVLKNIEDELNQLQDLQILTEIAAELKKDDEPAREEDSLLGALLGE